MSSLIITGLVLSNAFNFWEVEAIEPKNTTGMIYLYGESHGHETVLQEEFRLWNNYYHQLGMRHLFIEGSYGYGALLNRWMHEDTDELLDYLMTATQKAPAGLPAYRNFFLAIKKECPQTVFHGTDVEHQTNGIGRKYLRLLEEERKQDTEEYKNAKANYDQGVKYRNNNKNDNAGGLRENFMAENFIREFNNLGNESIMGIYGSAHTEPDFPCYASEDIGSMANQIAKVFPGQLISDCLSPRLLYHGNREWQTVTIAGKEYDALYLGEVDADAFKGDMNLASWKLWLVEDAYEDVKDFPRGLDNVSYWTFPIPLKEGQVYVFEGKYKTGETFMSYKLCDGTSSVFKGIPAAFEFIIEDEDSELSIE